MVGVAVKTTFVPKQLLEPVLLEILTEFEINGFTVIVMLLLVAVEEVTQLNDDVIVQEITSPLFNDDEVYVLLFVPTGEPFRYHW